MRSLQPELPSCLSRISRPSRPSRLSRLSLWCAAATVMASLTSASLASAEEGCNEVYVQVQKLRRDGKLVDARRPLETCLSACADDTPASKHAITRCQEWRKEDATRTPTLLISAKDGSQNDLSTVQVTIDGQVVASSLNGQPIPLNVGPHTVVLVGHGASETRTIVAADSERKKLAVVLGQVPLVLPPAGGAAPGGVPAAGPQAPAGDTGGGTPALKIVGYVSGGLGLVGIGIGTYFGLHSLSLDKEAKCDAMNICENPDARTAAQQSVTGAIGGFVAGGALLIGGLLMVVASPSSTKATAGRVGPVRATPLIGAGTLGVSFSGGW